MLSEMELTLEQTQQGASHEVSNDSNTSAGNPVKKILLKLNLSDHRSILTDPMAMQNGDGGFLLPTGSE
ncbi:hypothetical protein Tco_1133837 [Tanacetum coccineum]